MWGSNRIRVGALLCWGAHVIVILALAQGQVRIFLSDLLQFAIGALAVAACIQAARRSGPFGRTFWRLASFGFTLLVIGFALGTYADNFPPSKFLPSLGHHSWIIDVFVNAWTAPLVMCLFLDPESEPEGTDWRRILDFAQVGIVFVLLYLYSSNFAVPGEGIEPWRLALATDALITAGFFLRGLTTPTGPARALFLRFGYFRTVAVVTDAAFVLGMPESAPGNSFDLIWSLTTLIPVMIAASWNDSREIVPTKRATWSYWRLLTTQLMPLIFPVLVMLTASRILGRQLRVAAAAVLASLAITFTRLLLTQRAQEGSAEALRQSYRLLHSIMEGANEVIFVKDLEGRYLMINTTGAQMIGRTVAEVIGKTDPELFPPDTIRAMQQADEQVMQSGKAHTYELTMSVAGAARTLLATKGPYLGPQGELIGVIGIAVDVTDRRKLEEHLRQTQKMEAIGTLSGGVAHDFNNLLTVIKGYTGLLLDAVQEERLRVLVGHIDQAADRAASLTGQLLAFSRRQVLQPKTFDLNTLVLNLEMMLRRLIGEDIEMVTFTAPDLGSVRADPGQIEQVIMNLAVNARDAMPQGGKLTVETANVELDENYALEHLGAQAGRFVMLAVSDTGMGMNAETKARIFDPFFTTKELGKGTGLGLSTVYGIVKQSRGNIWVYSEPGRGSTLKIYLPRVDAPAEALTGEGKAPAKARGTETILLVEDDQHVRALARTALTAYGYSVLVAEDSTGVASMLDRHIGPIHLLLTDVVMPGLNGREVALQVAARRPDIKVLYMSGYTTNAIVHHGVLDAGTFILQKPFTPASLAAKVREVLDQSVSTGGGVTLDWEV
jgi:PAS domain S-box-containing protein